jgi:hypothetical protein
VPVALGKSTLVGGVRFSMIVQPNEGWKKFPSASPAKGLVSYDGASALEARFRRVRFTVLRKRKFSLRKTDIFSGIDLPEPTGAGKWQYFLSLTLAGMQCCAARPLPSTSLRCC